MKPNINFLKSFFLILFFTSVSYAQLLNSGFENWTVGALDNWTNIGAVNISQNTSHTEGTYAGLITGNGGSLTTQYISQTLTGLNAGSEYIISLDVASSSGDILLGIHDGSSFVTQKSEAVVSAYSNKTISFVAVASTTYEFRFAFDKTGALAMLVDNVVVTENRLSTPTLVTPINNAVDQQLNPTLTFNNTVVGADSYEIQVALDAGFTQLKNWNTGLTVGTYSPSRADDFFTDYYWRVKAHDNAGRYSDWSSVWIFKTRIGGPVLTNPVNGLTGVSIEPLFSWNAVPGAVSYKLYVDDANDFATPMYEVNEGANLSKQMSEIIANFPLDNNTMYYWKVAAVSAGGVEYDSQTYHFTTVPSVPVTMSLPNDVSIVNMTDITFYWYIIGSQGSMKFKIQVKESVVAPTSTEWLTPDFETTTLNTNHLFPLLQGKTYFWRVIVLSGIDEVIDYSDIWSFTTGGGTTVTPIQSWPISGATVYTNTPTLYWYLSTYAPGIEFQVKYSTSGTIGGLADVLELNTGDLYPTDMVVDGSTDLFLTLPSLTPGTPYYWQVRVYYPDTGEFGPWSGVEDFVTEGSGTLVKPIASYPTGGVAIYTTLPTLYWYLASSSSGLTFNIEIKPAGTLDGSIDYPNVNALFKLLTTSLVPGETYEWRVQSDNNGALAAGESAWSDTETFIITGGVGSGYPVITWPVGNPTVYTFRPTISWFIEGSQLGITEVVLKYKEGSNSADWDAEVGGISIPLPTSSYTFTTDLNEGSTYYFALASKDASGNLSVWDEDAFTIYSASSSITDPVLSAPIGGITLATKSPTLYWYVIGNQSLIQSYDVTYSTSDVFAVGATFTANSTNPFYALSNLTPGATYYWKVKTNYTNSTSSNYSTTETFIINPGANAIQPIVGGPNNVVVNTTSPTISWVLPAINNISLVSEITIADNPDMNNALLISDIANTQHNISNLEIGKSYFWRVRTKTEENVYSEFSGQGAFKIGDNVTEIKESKIIPTKFEVSQNYPNPFNPSTVIKYVLPDAQFVTLRIYNMLGQEVAELVNNQVNAGVHSIVWNGKDNSGAKVSTGTYIYRVVAGNNVIIKKMILLK